MLLLFCGACSGASETAGLAAAKGGDTPRPQPSLSLTSPPSELLRSSSTTPVTHGVRGSDFDPELPSSGVIPKPEGKGLASFIPGQPGASGLKGAAYALYQLNLQGYAGELIFDWSFNIEGTPAGFSLGLADFAADRWVWFPCEANGSLSPPDPARFIDPSSQRVLAAVLSSSADEAELSYLRVGENVPPVPILTVITPFESLPMPLSLFANYSYDVDGEIASYVFTLPDGSELSAAEGMITGIGISEPYNGPVSVVVSDLEGGSSTASEIVDLYYVPEVDLQISESSGMADLTVRLEALPLDPVHSSPPLFEWDFDGDGVFDLNSGTQSVVFHVYDTPGDFQPTVRLTEPGGHSRTDTRALSVSADSGEARWRRVALSGKDEWASTVDMTLLGGLPAVAWVDHRRDAGEHRLYFCLAKDAQGRDWNPPLIVADKLSTPALAMNLRSPLRMLLVDGKPAIVLCNKAESSSETLFIRASDALGTAWDSPQQVWDFGEDLEYIYSDLCIINGNPAITAAAPAGDFVFRRALDAQGSSWGDAKTIHAYGAYQPSLCDVDGRPAVAYEELDIYYKRADDASGDTWPILPNLLDADGKCPCLRIVDGRPAVAFDRGEELCFIPAADSAGSNWDSVQVLHQSSLGFGGFADLALIDGKPAISYGGTSQGEDRGLLWHTAGDGSGTTWSQSAPVYQPHWLSYAQSVGLELSGGEPGIACSSQGFSADFLVYY
ncbi:PKD domain-containing protein [bacterium]|nr:PKD domain-containing protein [bacterium]